MTTNRPKQFAAVLVVGGLISAAVSVFGWADSCEHPNCGRNIWYLAMAGLAGCALTSAWYEVRGSRSSIEDVPTATRPRKWTHMLILSVPIWTMAIVLVFESEGGRNLPTWCKPVAIVAIVAAWVLFFVDMVRRRNQP